MLADGTIEGFVGGQCAAGSVRTAALDALRDGDGRAAAGAARTATTPFPETPGAQVVVNPCLSGGALEIFLEPLLPSPLVCASSATRRSPRRVADLAALAGLRRRPAPPRSRADGATAVVVPAHGGDEPEAIRAALDAGVGFVGSGRQPHAAARRCSPSWT